MKIKQVYVPYWDWEDWKAGMWNKSQDEAAQLKEAIEFTADTELYSMAMQEVAQKWQNTMLNSLTNPTINKRAFLGHCAVCYITGIPEYITRLAWKELTEKQRQDADAAAQKHIDEWRSRYLNTLTHGNSDATA